jgi:hypothetical protein
MNLASALVGAFLIWAAGLAWEFPIDALLYQYFRIGTFNPGFWINFSIVCRSGYHRDRTQCY